MPRKADEKLLQAAIDGDVEACKRAVEGGANINVQSPVKSTLLGTLILY